MIEMMRNRTLFLAALLVFLLPWCLGLGNAPKKQERDIHVSKKVKIDQQEDTGKTAGKEKPAQKSSAAAEARSESEAGAPEIAPAEEQEQISGNGEGLEDASSAEKELEDMMLTEQEALLGDEERYYTRKGRVDPFEPFININEEESPNSPEEEQELERRKPQTPLEKIALSQLKLTAILHVPGKNKSIAMVEDQTGKGYVVSQGTYIGEKGGQIVDILEDRIIVEEKYKDVFGKIAVREIEKKLQN